MTDSDEVMMSASHRALLRARAESSAEIDRWRMRALTAEAKLDKQVGEPVVLVNNETIEALARASGCWIVQVGDAEGVSFEERVAALGVALGVELTARNVDQVGTPKWQRQLAHYIGGGGATVLFTGEAAAREFYAGIVGDDGSQTNDYSGPVRIYAAIYSPDRGCITENT